MNNLVDEYNNTYRSNGRKPIDADYSALTEEMEANLRAPKFKVGGRVRVIKVMIEWMIFDWFCVTN